jgi:hypothetical protein
LAVTFGLFRAHVLLETALKRETSSHVTQPLLSRGECPERSNKLA